jgi:heme a synthase
MQAPGPWLHRYAIFVAIFALAVIVSGALITSTEVAARLSQSAVSAGIYETLHRVLAVSLAILTLGIAVWTLLGTIPGWLRALAWSGAAAVALAAVGGWQPAPLSPNVGILHALLAHLSLTLSVVVAMGTSSGWNRDPELIDASTKPFLRPLAIATPPTVFLQIALGAAYRHDMTSVMPHMAIAMGVAFLALVGSSVILQNFQRPAPLRRAAAAVISIVLAQVCLGITAFLLLVLNATSTIYFVLATVGHVLVGAATLAASVVMAMQVWRSASKNPPGNAELVNVPSSPV